MALTAKRLRKLLHYNPRTGLFTWRITRKKAPAGAVAGCIKKGGGGYRFIGIDWKLYRASRLAHLWMNGCWPKAEIDHRNCNRSDDRWRNLRDANSLQNKRNMSIRKKKIVPLKGVGFHKSHNKYRAYIAINGHHVHIGYFDDPKEAHVAYVKAAKKHFGKFARAR